MCIVVQFHRFIVHLLVLQQIAWISCNESTHVTFVHQSRVRNCNVHRCFMPRQVERRCCNKRTQVTFEFFCLLASVLFLIKGSICYITTSIALEWKHIFFGFSNRHFRLQLSTQIVHSPQIVLTLDEKIALILIHVWHRKVYANVQPRFNRSAFWQTECLSEMIMALIRAIICQPFKNSISKNRLFHFHLTSWPFAPSANRNSKSLFLASTFSKRTAFDVGK